MNELATETQIVHKKKLDKLWNSMYIKMLIVSLFISICNNMLNTSLPLYVQQLGGDKSIAGLVMGVFTIAALVCRPLYGNLVDTKGRKIVLLIGISIYSVAAIGINLTTSIILILVIRGLQGVGFSGFSTAGGTVVADVLPGSRLNEGVGFYGISANVATAVGPGVALLLISTCGYSSVFVTAFAAGIAGLLLVMTFNYEKKAKMALQAHPDYVEPEKVKFTLKGAFEKSAIHGSMAQFFLIMPMGFAMTFMPTFGIAVGISNVGMYFTVNAIVLLASRFFVGKLADHYGANKVIIPGIVMIFAGTLILAFTTTMTQLLISSAVLGLGYGCINPTINAFIMKVSPIERRGAANATYYAAFDGGVGIGSMIGGMVVQALGFQFAFICFAGLTGVGFALFLKYLRKQINVVEAVQTQIC